MIETRTKKMTVRVSGFKPPCASVAAAMARLSAHDSIEQNSATKKQQKNHAHIHAQTHTDEMKERK